ncbi:hypothetical protein MHH52_16220 [Paenibacillus sp. FSL K6-0276]|uniref:hypothetical protein n=1 Tax=Paenibacillus sp. FSL K6-0276 TaxID=2921450 RepID=UPI0030EF5A7A
MVNKGGINIFSRTIKILEELILDGISEQTEGRINQLISILKGGAIDVTSFFEIADLIEQILVFLRE